ncbi:MAG: hypothetical protein M3367_15620 [Acidobacteriota bacterium]|nr:hypothetical protein [Acidobacteriota bacterium]
MEKIVRRGAATEATLVWKPKHFLISPLWANQSRKRKDGLSDYALQRTEKLIGDYASLIAPAL